MTKDERMIYAALYISIIMLLIAIIHVYWAMGGNWPAKERTRQGLIDQFVGRGTEFPSTSITLFVTIFFLIMAIIPLIKVQLIQVPISDSYIHNISILFSIVFLLRGLAGHLPAMRKRATSIFNYYNIRVYNPLCISLGMAQLLLII